jgi:hypothetical protein
MDEESMDEDGTPKRHRRRRWIVLGVLGAVVVIVGAVVATILLTREEAEEVSLRDASRRFTEQHPSVSADGGVLAPAEGIYEYRGHGFDKLSVLPFEQTHGPTMPGTVVHTKGGCWRFRIDYSTHHWQDWIYCPRPDHGLDEHGGRTFQRWDIGVTTIDNHSTFTCRKSPVLVAGMKKGDTWVQRCGGVNDQVSGETVSAGNTTYLGLVPVEIGGDRVRAYHLLQRRTISGAQSGKESSELWFAPNGLPLHERHTISIKSPSPIGDISYDEVTDFRLQELAPRP